MVNPLNVLSSRLRMRHIRLLTVLGECGSLRKAAEIMSQTQPALTKSLHEIEELIGEPLFSRTPKGLQPNTLGEALTRYARLVYADLGGVHKELTALRSGSIGNIHIGGLSALTNSLLPETIAFLKNEHPSLNISVEVETSDLLVKALEQDKLDLVIARIPENHPSENLNFVAFDAEVIVPVASSGHPEMRNSELTLEALRKYCWVIQPQPAPLRMFFHQLFRDAQTSLPVSTIETSSTLLALSLLKGSAMVSLQPVSLINYYEKMNIIGRLPISLSIKMNAYGLITRKNRIPTAAMQVVADAFLRHANLKTTKNN
jgi:DNA-binding transcriptional LysR family regulator